MLSGDSVIADLGERLFPSAMEYFFTHSNGTDFYGASALLLMSIGLSIQSRLVRTSQSRADAALGGDESSKDSVATAAIDTLISLQQRLNVSEQVLTRLKNEVEQLSHCARNLSGINGRLTNFSFSLRTLSRTAAGESTEGTGEKWEDAQSIAEDMRIADRSLHLFLQRQRSELTDQHSQLLRSRTEIGKILRTMIDAMQEIRDC